MIKACIFDFDGTLADSLMSMAVIGNQVLTELGLHELPKDNYRYYCGEGATVLMKRCLTDAGDPEHKFLEQGDRRYRELFQRNPLFEVRIYDGILEILKELKAKSIRLAVLSNKPDPAAQTAAKNLFGDTFDVIIGQQDGIPRKPSPVGALKIAEKFGVCPEECMYIGDTATDMQTGKAAGMYTIGVLWGFRDEKELRENHADALVKEPKELLRFIF